MPERDEGKDGHEIHARPDHHPHGILLAALGAAAAAQRHENVAHRPAIEAAMPAAPEREGRVVVAHAADHVLRGVDAVAEGPETEEAPGDEQLQPDDVEVEVGEHGELEGRVRAPVRVGFGDGDGVDEVQDELHGEEGEQEADAVEEGALGGDGAEGVAELGYIVVEGDDGAGDVERGVEGVGEVVTECIVGRSGG